MTEQDHDVSASNATENQGRPGGEEQTDEDGGLELHLDDEVIPIPQEVLERLPSEAKPIVERFFAGGMARIERQSHPLLDKLTSEHIPLLIDSTERDAERRLLDAQRQRWFSLGYCALGVGLFVFLVLVLGAGNPDLLEKVLTLSVGFIGGFGGGYAYRSRRRD